MSNNVQRQNMYNIIYVGCLICKKKKNPIYQLFIVFNVQHSQRPTLNMYLILFNLNYIQIE